MTGLTQIQELCEPLLTALGPEYSKRYNEELKDLKNVKLCESGVENNSIIFTVNHFP